MKKAVHFGAGNIGRGFIGVLLHRAGYEVVFADVVEALVNELNHHKSYRVLTLDADVQIDQVDHVRAVLLGSDACIQEMVDASIITTAVGLGNLDNVAEIIYQALQMRHQNNPDQLLTIMACENAIRATSSLHDAIREHCDDALIEWMDSTVGFADVAVDRIAPNRDGYATQPLDAVVERFFEWDIENVHLKEQLNIPGATFVSHLDPYLERKLFILNGAHATAAYAGYQKQYTTVLEAMGDLTIAELVASVQHEAILGLVHQYPDSLNKNQLEKYAESVRERFLNPHIHDDVSRVGRDPLRKLSPDDRLVGPLKRALAVTNQTPGLIMAIALGLSYDNKDDQTAVELQQEIQGQGVEEAAKSVTGLTDQSLLEKITGAYEDIKQKHANLASVSTSDNRSI